MRRHVLALTLALIGLAAPAAAQEHCALEVLSPRAVGAAGSGLDSDNRVYSAYPGLEYNIQVIAICGTYPYTFALSSQPAGMSIDAGPATATGPLNTAGIISWTPASSTDDDPSITVTVTDADGHTATGTWPIDVVDPVTQTRFRFLDAINGHAHSTNGGTGTGTAANPWLTLDDAYDGSGANSICYYRTGTYTVGNLPLTNADDVNGEERVTWSSASRCTIWLEYPGDTAIVDFAYTGNGCGSLSSPTYNCGQSIPRFRMSGDVTYVDGLSFTRMMTVGFQMERTNRQGVLVRRSAFSVAGPGINGGNSAMIMWTQTYGGGGTPGTQVVGDTVVNSTFTNTTGNGYIDALKAYSWSKGVVADDTFTDFNVGFLVESVALKADVSDFTVRGNTFTNATLGGNNDSHNVGELTGGTVNHNRFLGTGTEYLGESRVDCCLGVFHIERNTFAGPSIKLESLATGDGPIDFTQNVIINAQAASGSCPAKFNCFPGGGDDVVDFTTFTLVNNLTGIAADNIIDSNGDLLAPYIASDGPASPTPKGYQLGAGGAAAPGGPVRLPFRRADAVWLDAWLYAGGLR